MATVTPLVRRIEVRGLHGRFDYSLDFEAVQASARLVLLYGDNGSGKTTVLRLLWNLLSPAGNRYHRTFMSQIAFQSFGVLLAGGTRIEATRKLPVAGPFQIEVRRRGVEPSISEWPDRVPFEDYFSDWPVEHFDERLREFERNGEEVVLAARAALAKTRYLHFLSTLGAGPYLLADDRSTASDELPKFVEDRHRRRLAEQSTEAVEPKRLAHELEVSIDRLNQMLQRLTIGAAASGSANANSVYLDILKQVGMTSTAEASSETLREALIEVIEDLGKRSSQFEELGLIPKFVSKQFATYVKALPGERVQVADSILRPYVESIDARLNALEESRLVISTFLKAANSFLDGKSLIFDARRGISIRLDDGEVLAPSQLSSGECHVVLLLANAILAREGSRLVLIDEPELSLNVKWQRSIVSALLACTDGTSVQFVIATHSVELMSSHRTSVVRMRSDE